MKKYKYLSFLIFIIFSKICLANSDFFFEAYDFQKIGSNKSVLAKNSDMLIIPASTMKILTSYAALKVLGEDFQFSTKFMAKHKPAAKLLKEDLIIKFAGNVDFKYDDISKMFKKANIQHIKGNIVIDDSIFDQKYYPFGYSIENINQCYAAPVSSIIMDGNCFRAKTIVKNGFLIAKKNKSHSPNIKGRAKLVKSENNFCELELASNNQNQYQLYGCHETKDELPKLNIAYANPRLMFRKSLARVLKKDNIKFRKIVFQKSNENKHILADSRSRQLQFILQEFLSNSNNLIGNTIFKMLDYKWKQNDEPSRWNSASYNFIRFLQQEKIATQEEVKLFDGAGISQKNLITSKVFLRLLDKIANNKKFLKIFLASMPEKDGIIEGTGTLFGRLGGLRNDIKIVAKTGYIDGAISLTGFIYEKGVMTHKFYYTINNLNADFKMAKQLLDEKFVKMVNQLNTV